MERVRLNFVPEFKMVEPCAVGVAWKNLWRVRPVHTFEDLMGEARYCFVKVSKAYPQVRTEKHFGSLFYRTFTNRIHRLALEVSKQRPVMGFNASGLSDNPNILDCFQAGQNGADIAQQIIRTEGAPEPILKLIKRLEEKQECEANGHQPVLCPSYSHIEDYSLRLKLLNEWLCVIAGVPAGTNMMEMLRNWIYGELQTC